MGRRPNTVGFGAPIEPGRSRSAKGYGSGTLNAARGGTTSLRRAFDTVDSTQDVALDLARRGEPAGTLVVAKQQRRGRGRLDHRWSSPPGGLYLSIVLPEPPNGASLVPLALALAVRGTLSGYGVQPVLKWPNDLLVIAPPRPPRKISGILVDRVPSTSFGHALVAGVGVNVNADPRAYPAELQPRVVQLSELVGRPIAPGEVEGALVPRLLQAIEDLGTEPGWRATAERCRQALYGRGRRVWVDGAAAGVLRDLDDDGAIWLDSVAGRVAVRAGDLTVEDG
jgi:BirA family transcriptional regulator, biotin operon repressor / biotin---[acetyl-CoA-carboxylase] ligase